MIEIPQYEHPMGVATPHFRCARHGGALLSVPACGQRWKAALDGEQCHRCPLGRQHAQPPKLAHTASGPARCVPADAGITQSRDWFEHRYDGGPCVRCGRGDLRLIGGTTCVSCYNRQAEWAKQRNAKNKVPATYRALFTAEIGIELQDGAVETRLFDVQHQAEVVARGLRVMDRTPGAVRIVAAPRPSPSAWNPRTKTFEHQCRECDAVGLVLERRRGDVLERRCWSCNLEMDITGWSMSPVRQPVVALDVNTAADWLSSDPTLRGETPAWTPSPFVCGDCHAGQVEALPVPGGRWRCRCRACGTTSGEGAA